MGKIDYILENKGKFSWFLKDKIVFGKEGSIYVSWEYLYINKFFCW